MDNAQEPNHLINETSPYLLQHAYNPVKWYPWGEEAFEMAKKEDKPIFLSIGYSTCHWCHVMERESFEDFEVAQHLNENFISIKVDKEERPDVDSVYMGVCQAMTGSGGWPLTILMTPDKKPFYACTYLPKHGRNNMLGLIDLLSQIQLKWINERERIEKSADKVVDYFSSEIVKSNNPTGEESLIRSGIQNMQKSFDDIYGGFGRAPKFPMGHNLLFLISHYELNGDTNSLEMAETTLLQMFKGGIFDHIGGGFSRYSTDKKWLAPHFEKMLYDNALLIMAYNKAFEATGKEIYKNIVIKTIKYVFRDLYDENGGFYCAQDADSDGVEGKFYIFTPEEILGLLGKNDGLAFNKYFDITEKGNFEGENIPNLIKNDNYADFSMSESTIKTVFDYRKSRMKLHTDDKILSSWNGLMIGALADAGIIDQENITLAEKAYSFVENNLTLGNKIYTSYRDGKKTTTGFLDDYAFVVFGLLKLYAKTLKKEYLDKADLFTKTAINEFWDENGGFFLYGKNAEQHFMRPKEIYDGAMPSGNSVMFYNLFVLQNLIKTNYYEDYFNKQKNFLLAKTSDYPNGYCFFLNTLILSQTEHQQIICVLKDKAEFAHIKNKLPKNEFVIIIEETESYPLKNNKTTFYVCKNNTCFPPSNEL